jgi:uncharacterized protein YxjI
MLYTIREKIWTFTDRFAIEDAGGNPCYSVRGKFFSWGHNLSFEDTAGRQLAEIQQTLFSFLPRYQILIEGRGVAEFVKQFSWFQQKFLLDIPGPNDYEIEGSFWQRDFVFRRGGRAVAIISKPLSMWSDRYTVEIDSGENDILILCACVVIDQMLHDETSSV